MSAPKDPTPATQAANAAVMAQLPFADQTDFADAMRGFVAGLPEGGVRTPNGTAIWDLAPYDFLQAADAPATVNPSLWRMARLNMASGLFQVTDRVWQVRGLDLANLTLIEGDTGLIVIDTLTTNEVARAAMALYFAHRPARPIHAIIYTHSHSDHFGGVKGVVTQADVDAGRIAVIAPDKFMEAVGGENVLPGNAMGRRAQFQFGGLLRQGPRGQVDAGLGKTTARGTQSLIAPTQLIRDPIETHTIDGVEIIFQLAPETEAPAEMHLFLPSLGVLNIAENATRHLHNFLPLRGAVVRDPRMWAHYLAEAIDRFCPAAEILIAQHHWPVWGATNVRAYLEAQHDLYKFIHDQSVRLLNLGRKPEEIADEITLPDSLASKWFLRGYYGSLKHNAKAVYQRYLGWYDGNPATLDRLPPTETAIHTLRYMGGADAAFALAQADFAAGDYRWVAQIMGQALLAAPDHAGIRALLADSVEQLGYQAESATWRNAYLYAAQELRHGKRDIPPRPMLAPELVAGLPTDLLLDYLAVRLNPTRAANAAIALDITLTDRAEHWNLALRNCVLACLPGHRAATAHLTCTRATLEALCLGLAEPDAAQITGTPATVLALFAMFDRFNLMFDVIAPPPSLRTK